MKELKTAKTSQKGSISDIPVAAAQEYISDMLGELCVIAKTSGQTDILTLLQITRQAVLASLSKQP